MKNSFRIEIYSPEEATMSKTVMKGVRLLLLFLGLSVFAGIQFAEAQSKDRLLYVPGEILVKFKADLTNDAKILLKNEYRLELLKRFNRIDVEHLRILSDLSVEEITNKLKASGIVEYAEPNYYRYLNAGPNDPRYPEMWGLNNTGQTGGTLDADIDAPEAWDIVTGDPNFVVADIDSGLDMAHPDLAANVWTNPDEIPGNGIDDDGNGYMDDVHGWDFSGGDNDPSDTVAVCGGHGTHTSGTIGAIGNNSIGVTGINWNVKIMPLKVFKQVLFIFCSASDSDIISAIEYAADKEVKVSNNSYGGGAYSQALYDAIKASKSLFIAAAGNEGNNNDTNPSYPASYDLNNIIAVAATDHNDALASFSNYGVTSVDIAAPGVNILSTTPNNTYSFYNGTSMATPHVVGAASLLWADDQSLTVNELKWRLLEGVDSKGLPVLSSGRLNINNSLNLPPPLVTVDLSPLGSTNVPRGGTVSYNILITNQSPETQNVKVSIVAQMPNGDEIILNGPTTISITAGQVVSRTFSRQVPINAQTGDYTLFGRSEITSQSFDEDPVVYVIY